MSYKYTRDDLKIMQNWSLERKIKVTQTRIIEWYQYYNGMVYVSFSGGKDSTVLLDLTRRIYPNIEAVFVDTGLEYPELREFIKTIDNVTWLKPKMNFRKVIETYGYPIISKEVSKIIYGAKHSKNKKRNYLLRLNGYNSDGTYSKFRQSFKKYKNLIEAPFEISNRCCIVMKEQPFLDYERLSGKKPIIATMATESQQRMDGWLKTGCNAFNSCRQISKPMSFWTEQDVLQYLEEFEIPYARVYGEIKQNDNGKYYTTGCDRTGCIFCGFGCHLEKEPNRFQRLKITHPKMWDYCMKSWNKGGLGMKEVLNYIGVKTE